MKFGYTSREGLGCRVEVENANLSSTGLYYVRTPELGGTEVMHMDDLGELVPFSGYGTLTVFLLQEH